MSRSRLLAALVALAPVLLSAAAGRADEPRPLWSAPRACPPASAFRAAIRRELGRPLDRAEAAAIRATVTRHRGRFRLSLATGAGRRTLEGPECAELLRAAALFVSLALREGALEEPSVGFEVVQIVDRESPGRAPPARAPPPVSTTQAPERPPGIALGAVVETDVGTLPGAALGVGASLARVSGPWRLETTLHYLFGEKARLPEMQGVGGDFSAALVSLRGCRELFAGLGAGVCAGLDLGAMRGESFGLEQGGSDVVPMSALALGLEGSWWLAGPLYLHLDAELFGRLAQEKFRAQVATYPGPDPELRTLYRTETVSARTFTGLELRFR